MDSHPSCQNIQSNCTFGYIKIYPTTVSATEMEMPMHGVQCNSRNFPCKKKEEILTF